MGTSNPWNLTCLVSNNDGIENSLERRLILQHQKNKPAAREEITERTGKMEGLRML